MARVFDASWQRPKAPQVVAVPKLVPLAGRPNSYVGPLLNFDNPEHREAWHAYTLSVLQPGDGIILYASRTTSKCPTIAEVAAYREAGVDDTLGFVFEDSATRASTGTHADGLADGQLTLSMLKARGHAKGKPAYYACDTSEPLSLDYAKGFADGLAGYYEPRLYAGDFNLAKAAAIGQRNGWQAGAASWSEYWDFGASHGAYGGASLYQVAGTSPIPGTDLNVIHTPDWNGPSTQEDDMTPEQAQMLTDLHNWFQSAEDSKGTVHPNTGSGQLNAGATIGSGYNRLSDIYNQNNRIYGGVVAIQAASNPTKVASLLAPVLVAAIQAAGAAEVTEDMLAAALVKALTELAAQ